MILEERFTAPDGWQWHNFKNMNGQSLRYGFCTVTNPKGLIVLAAGRTETSEEYFETARDYLRRDFAVAVLDWPGQGLSYRFNSNNKQNSSHIFQSSLNDFDQWLSVLDTQHGGSALPKVLIAHSMGSNVALRYLTNNPDKFDCAVMIAPMLGIRLKPLFRILAKPLLGLARKKGWMGQYAITQGPWSEQRYNVTKLWFSTDPIRREIQKYWYLKNPELQCGGVTYGWLSEALNSVAVLHQPDVAGKITTPTLFMLAGNDVIVNNNDALKTIRHMPNTEIVTLQQSYHNMLKENDYVRNDALKSMDSFINKHLHQNPRP